MFGVNLAPQGDSNLLLTNSGPAERENRFLKEYVFVDRIAADLENVRRRTEMLNHNYEYTKVRWAAAGHKMYSVQGEMDRLEFGRPFMWDARFYNSHNDDGTAHVSLAQVYPELTLSRYDRDTMRGVA